MEIAGERRIPATRDVVWAALNDPDVLKDCIPGCESLEKVTDTEMNGLVRAKVGPVNAKFSGTVRLENIKAPESYTIAGEGKGGAAGFAKGSADVALAEDGADTVLTYTAKAQVGGKLAQIGSRLVKGTAEKLANDFFTCFADRVGGTAGPAAEPETEEPEAAAVAADAATQRGITPLIWIGALIVVAAIFLWLVAG